MVCQPYVTPGCVRCRALKITQNNRLLCRFYETVVPKTIFPLRSWWFFYPSFYYFLLYRMEHSIQGVLIMRTCCFSYKSRHGMLHVSSMLSVGILCSGLECRLQYLSVTHAHTHTTTPLVHKYTKNTTYTTSTIALLENYKYFTIIWTMIPHKLVSLAQMLMWTWPIYAPASVQCSDYKLNIKGTMRCLWSRLTTQSNDVIPYAMHYVNVRHVRINSHEKWKRLNTSQKKWLLVLMTMSPR